MPQSRRQSPWLVPVTAEALARRFVTLGLAGLGVGLVASLLLRLELQTPGIQFLAGASYTTTVVAHGTASTLLGAVPLLFSGLGLLAMARGLDVTRLALWPLQAVALFCATAALATFAVAVLLLLAGSPAAPMLPKGAIALAYLSVIGMAGAYLATLAARLRGVSGAGNVSPAAWGMALASTAALVIIPLAGYGQLASSLPSFRRALGAVPVTSASAVAPTLGEALSWLDPSSLLIGLAALAVASDAIAVSSGRSSTGSRAESAMLVIAALAAIALSLFSVMLVAGAIAPRNPFVVATANVMPAAVVTLSMIWVLRMIAARQRRWLPALWLASAVLVLAGATVIDLLVARRTMAVLLHDTAYAVAIQHWSLLMAATAIVMAGLFANFRALTGCDYRPAPALVGWVLAVVGTTSAFLPMVALGLSGMPRRQADYPDLFANDNFAASVGSYIGLASVLLLVLTVVTARRADQDDTSA